MRPVRGRGDPGRIDEVDRLVRRGLDQEELDRKMEQLLSHRARRPVGGLVARQPQVGAVVIFVCGATAHDPRALRRLAACSGVDSEHPGLSTSVGIGDSPRTRADGQGYQEALVALKWAGNWKGPGA